MSEQPQTIEVRAVPPRVPRDRASRRPVVPLRRAVVATLDTAALVTTGAVAEFGVIGVAAGAATAVGVPLVARAARRAGKRREQARAAKVTTSTTRTSGPGSGSGRAGGGGGSLAGRGSGGSSGTAGRRLRNLLGAGPGRAGGGAGGGRPGGARSAGLGGSRTPAGGGRSNSRGPLGLLDRLTGRNPSLRQQRRHARRLADGLERDATKRGEWAERRAKRRAERERRKQEKAARKAAERQRRGTRDTNAGDKPKVGTELRGEQKPEPATVPGPDLSLLGALLVPARNNTRKDAAVAETGTSAAMRRMLALAEEMYGIAAKHAPEGNLEVLAGYVEMPNVMDMVLKALVQFHKAATSQGLHPAVVEYIEAMVKAQRSTADAARAIAPAIEKLHKTELEYLRAGGSARWDRRVNSGPVPTRGRRTSTPAPAAGSESQAA